MRVSRGFVLGGPRGADQRRDRGAARRQTAAEHRGASRREPGDRAYHTRFCSDFTGGELNFWDLKLDLSSLSLLSLSSRRAADLHCGCYNVISLSSSILTADCRERLEENRQNQRLW